MKAANVSEAVLTATEERVLTLVSRWMANREIAFSRSPVIVIRTVKIGVQNDFNYSPSVGFTYALLEWLKVFGRRFH